MFRDPVEKVIKIVRAYRSVINIADNIVSLIENDKLVEKKLIREYYKCRLILDSTIKDKSGDINDTKT